MLEKLFVEFDLAWPSFAEKNFSVSGCGKLVEISLKGLASEIEVNQVQSIKFIYMSHFSNTADKSASHRENIK